MRIKVAIFENDICEIFDYRLDSFNYIIVRKKLEKVRKDIINRLKELKNQGKIKSISRPRNRNIQRFLDELIETKRIIQKSISQIKEIYYKN